MCNAVREQVEQESMRDQLTPPPPPKSKAKKGEEVPFKFELPLDKPLCDNTTKFSKWIKKKKPHLADKILQCAWRTLPALRGRSDRMRNISTASRPTSSSTSSSCGVCGARVSRLLLSCRRRLSSGWSPEMSTKPPSGSRSTGPVIEETTCSRMLVLAEPTTTAEPKADGTV